LLALNGFAVEIKATIGIRLIILAARKLAMNTSQSFLRIMGSFNQSLHAKYMGRMPPFTDVRGG